MRKFIVLILTSTLALVLTQCSAKPSRRTHSNAIGIWVGTADVPNDDEGEYKIQSWAVGVNLKHLIRNDPIWYIFRPTTNSSFNVNSGIHFGKNYGISVDASYHVLTDDLNITLDGSGSGSFQFYAGPSLGASVISKSSKPFRLNPKLGFSGGMLMLFPPSGKYPESDLSFDGMISMTDEIYEKFKTGKSSKNEPDGIIRAIYHLYLF